MSDGNIDVEKVYDNYARGFNGRMPKGDLPEKQKKVTYPHPNKQGEMTSQNYIEYDDLAVVVFVRRGENGKFEFGLVEKEAPAFIAEIGDETIPQTYKGMFLEAPSFAFPQKGQVPDNIEMWIEEQILAMGFEMQGFSVLDDSKTAVCQSFTNQDARFYVAGIKEEEKADDRIHWFSISSLESYLDMQRMGGRDNLHSSIQTLYPLEQLRIKYLDQIRKMNKTNFELDRPLAELVPIERKKSNPSYRFNIWETTYKNTKDGQTKVATYLTSRSNAANTILMTQDGETMFLSPQQRSPYLNEGEEIKTEVAGGLLEGKTYERTALAELEEEQGFIAKSAKIFTAPLAATPLNSEMSQAFMAYYEKGKEGKQNLDEQEKISEKQGKSFKELKDNIRDPKIPLTTKYYIMLVSRDKEKEKHKEDIEK